MPTVLPGYICDFEKIIKMRLTFTFSVIMKDSYKEQEVSTALGT